MSEPLNRLENEALRLTAPERARLARTLLESLDAAAEDEAEVAAAWEREVDIRVRRFRAGGVSPIAAADVFESARAALGKK